MKHVWILNHYALEPGGAGGTRHFSLAKHLPANGWKATILAASTEHGTGRQRLADGEAKTRFMEPGDTVRVEMKDKDGHSIFGAIEQKVVEA